MRTYKDVIGRIAAESASVRVDNYFSGSMIPRGLDSHAISVALHEVYSDVSHREIRAEFEKLEDHSFKAKLDAHWERMGKS